MPTRSLLPDLAIHLDVGDGVEPAAARRFARIFRAAWRHLPDPARRTIAMHWLGPAWPVCVDLCHGPLVYAGRPQRKVWAVCQGHSGNHLVFVADWLDRLDGDLQGALIAHEWAHVHQHVTGGPYDEDSADELATSWGFDVAGLRQRADELRPMPHCVTVIVEQVAAPPPEQPLRVRA